MNATPNDFTAGLGRVLFSETALQRRVAELGAQISRDYAGLNPVVVGVLKGVMFFMSDLLRTLTLPVQVDFMAISRYQAGAGAKGPVRLTKDLDEPVEDRHVLFVEDVIDTGLTLSYLLRNLRARGPGQPRSLHPVRQAPAPSRRREDPLQGVRPARSLRRRLRAGLPRSLPAPALRRRADARSIGLLERPAEPAALVKRSPASAQERIRKPASRFQVQAQEN